MSKQPVFIVDNDPDDQFLVKEVWKELNLRNPVFFFKDADEVLNHIKSNSQAPFIIISDVNLPRQDGFDLRQTLMSDDTLKYKSVPFIFWSSRASNQQIKKAYDLCVHGFFVKEQDFPEIKKTFCTIVDYWVKSRSPET